MRPFENPIPRSTAAAVIALDQAQAAQASYMSKMDIIAGFGWIIGIIIVVAIIAVIVWALFHFKIIGGGGGSSGAAASAAAAAAAASAAAAML